jgi:hypothetical protein
MSSIEIRLGASDAFAPPLKLALPAGGGLLRSPEEQNELFFSARRRPMAIRTYFWNVSLAGQVANSSSTFLWHYGIRQGPQKPADVRGARSLPQSAAGPPLSVNAYFPGQGGDRARS